PSVFEQLFIEIARFTHDHERRERLRTRSLKLLLTRSQEFRLVDRLPFPRLRLREDAPRPRRRLLHHGLPVALLLLSEHGRSLPLVLAPDAVERPLKAGLGRTGAVGAPGVRHDHAA